MSDPYRPSNYYPPPPPSQSAYQPATYASSDQYASGALTTRHGSATENYHPSQSNLQLSQSTYQPPSSNSQYRAPDARRSRHHKSRSHSRHGRDRSTSRDRDLKRSKSRAKEWGSTAVGAAAGGLIGNELGHGPLATIGGLVAGAYGAHELEKRHERHREKKRAQDPYEERGGHRRRRSSGGLVDGLKEKVEGFLNPDRGERRSRSHVGSTAKREKARGYESDGYSSDERYERRSRRRDDGY